MALSALDVSATEGTKAWHLNAERLTVWALQHLKNRNDAYGQYLSLQQRTEKRKAVTKREDATHDVLLQHFSADDPGDLIGLHTTSPENTCRWLAVDIDQHSENYSPEAAGNEDVALALYAELSQCGCEALLLDSNGAGGFHLLLIFESPIPADWAHRIAQFLAAKCKERGLSKEPEAFPKQDRLLPGKLGNFLRLPGLHHTRAHVTRVWDGVGAWLENEAAIDAICSHRPLATGEAELLHEIACEHAKPRVTTPETAEIPEAAAANPIEAFLKHFGCVKPSGSGWIACCPAHADGTPSLAINQKENKILLHCHAGCNVQDVLKHAGLSLEDLFLPEDGFDGLWGRQQTCRTRGRDVRRGLDLESVYRKARDSTQSCDLERLAEQLGVSSESLDSLDVVWCKHEQAWLFPEKGHKRRICGLLRRYPDGRKQLIAGGQRGLYIPKSFDEHADMIVIVEGGSDTAAAVSQGWNAIGCPAAGQGIGHIQSLLKDARGKIFVVGDNDAKRDGTWPGRRGAERVAKALVYHVQGSVSISSPPMQFKDVREWLANKGGAQ